MRWFGFLAAALALLVLGASPGIARVPRAGAPTSALGQCANRINGTSAAINNCDGAAWVNGNLNRNDSLYREGDFVPFRTVITGLVPGDPYTLQIGYDAVESGLHAYDYLGTYNASAHPLQQIDPCSSIGDTAGDHACGKAPSTTPVPHDIDTTLPNGTHPPPAGDFAAWGAGLTGASYPGGQGPIVVTTGGTIERLINVTFKAEGPTVVLAWGGHIASVLDWGQGNTFIDAHSGSAFHMRLHTLNGASTGHNDRSLDAAALAPVPAPFTTSVTTPTMPVVIGQRVVDTAMLTAVDGNPVKGDVRFFVCGPATANPECSSGGTEAFEPPVKVLRTPVNPDDGTASIGFTPTAAGHYCFRAEYTPAEDALYSPAVHTDQVDECFEAVLPPPTLTLTKVCVGSPSGTWNLLLDGAGVLPSAACDATTGPIVTTPGTHTVSETRSSGGNNFTATVGGNCTDLGTTPASGQVTLALGESKSCTITNVANGQPTPATLTVNKVCATTPDTGLFNILVDGIHGLVFPDVPCGGTTGSVTVAPSAQHTVSEENGTGTNLDDYQAPVIGGDCAADGSITIPSGQSRTCTITNTRIPLPTTLTVEKACRPSTDPGQFRVTVTTTDTQTGVAQKVLGCGDSLGPLHVTPGESLTVDEEGANGTDLADYSHSFGTDCSSTGQVTVAAEQQATCLITNERKATPSASLSVVKICEPDTDGGLFDITIAGFGTARGVTCGQTIGPVALAPGQHTISEAAGVGTSLSDYTTTIGGDCAANGSITLTPGQVASCTITNVRKGAPPQPALVKVTKICVPASDGGRFNLTIDGQTASNVACGGSFGPVVVAAGLHHVTESAGTGTSMGDYRTTIGGSCAANGSVTVAAGQSAICTITNVRKGEETGSVDILKKCSPPGRHGRFQIELDDLVFRGIPCGGSTGPVTLGVGDHQIGEVATIANTDRFITTVGGDCSASGSFTLNAGQRLTCTVTNRLVRPKPPPKPPKACYKLHVARRMVTVGKRRVVARVHVGRRPVRGVRVYARGPGVHTVRTTGPTGRAVFVLRLRRPGILSLTIRKAFDCPRRDPRLIGIHGLRQPILTG